MDFSKAPSDATHYIPASSRNYLTWIKDMNSHSYQYMLVRDGDRTEWSGPLKYNGIVCRDALPIPVQVYNSEMLHEQLQRMIDNKDSEIFDETTNEWTDSSNKVLYVTGGVQYRAKLKELVIPWEWIAKSVDVVQVGPDGEVYDGNLCRIPLNLDLDGIELPIRIERP